MKRYVIYIKLVLALLLLVSLYAFTNTRNSNRKAMAPKVTFLNGDNLFITHEAVNKLLIQNIKGASSVAKETLVLSTVENALNANKMIQEAQVFLTINGQLEAKIKQRTPIARVSGTTSYYIDVEGKTMPLSEVYTARVPIITGAINSEILPDAYKLSKFINEDLFLKKNVIGIHCTNKQFELRLRSDSFEVEVGTIDGLEKKLSNFKAFYQKALKDNTLDKFSSVNLKFGNQVVCTKK